MLGVVLLEIEGFISMLALIATLSLLIQTPVRQRELDASVSIICALSRATSVAIGSAGPGETPSSSFQGDDHAPHGHALTTEVAGSAPRETPTSLFRVPCRGISDIGIASTVVNCSHNACNCVVFRRFQTLLEHMLLLAYYKHSHDLLVVLKVRVIFCLRCRCRQ